MKLLKQYKNLIMLVAVIVLAICVVASDPLGMIAGRKLARERIYNQIAIEEAETEKRIAVIKVEQKAEMIRIYQGIGNAGAEGEPGSHGENE